MKQKIIVKLSITDEKSRKKAMKSVVSHSGVVSATLQGQEKNQIEVIGDGIDSVVITTLLRKSVGYADLVSVNPIPEKKEGQTGGEKGGDDKKGTQNPNITPVPMAYPQYYYPSNGYYLEVRDSNYDSGCNIM